MTCCVSPDGTLCAGQHSVADPLGKARSASLRREEALLSSRGVVAPPGVSVTSSPATAAVGAAPGMQFDVASLPTQLQGISVKELVKALGLLHSAYTKQITTVYDTKLLNG